MRSPPLTVLIPTHGRPTLLERTLESLKECILPPSYRELVVIENGSRDGAEQAVKALPERLNARYMHENWGNKSHALNVALETVEKDLIVFFDDDVRIYPDTLVLYAERASSHDRGVFFGGPVEVDYESPPPEWLKPSLPLSARGYAVTEEGRDFYLGFNWAAFAQDVRDVGKFDPRFGPGSSTGATGQEADMQARLLEAGCSSESVPSAGVVHYVPKEKCTLSRVIDRKVKLGVHHSIKKSYSKSEIILSMLAFSKHILKSAILKNKKELCSGVKNVSYQIGLLKTEIKKRKIL